MTEETKSHSEQQAAAQLESIREMVAALDCDYDRLEELREERADLMQQIEESECGGESDEVIAASKASATEALAQWDEENAEELAELTAAAGECKDADEARRRIEEDALSVQVRSGWYTPGEESPDAEEYEILLCTGGPAVRIIGELSGDEPHSARMQRQDWGTPWTEYFEPGAQDILLRYASCFYFGS